MWNKMICSKSETCRVQCVQWEDAADDFHEQKTLPHPDGYTLWCINQQFFRQFGRRFPSGRGFPIILLAANVQNGINT